MTSIINGSSPTVTFSDGTTQSTAGLPLTGGTVTGNLTTSGLIVGATALGAGNATRFKNRIINGDMRIAQRTTSSQTISTTAVYPVDRFGVNANITSGSTTIQSSTVPTGQGFIKSSLVTVGTGATPSGSDYFRFRQIIEGLNIADLEWGTASAKTITISFWVRSSLTGTFGIGLQSSDSGYGSSYTINAANTWEFKTITIAGATGGTWATDNSSGINVLWDLGEGPSRCAASLNTWSYASTACGLSGGTKLAATSGATFYITGVQLEVGSSATGFEYVDYTTQLAMCQRYFVNIPANYEAIAYYSDRLTNGMMFLPVVMRTSPTLTGGSWTAHTGNAGTYAVANITPNYFRQYNSANNWTAGAICTVVSAVLVSAEL